MLGAFDNVCFTDRCGLMIVHALWFNDCSCIVHA